MGLGLTLREKMRKIQRKGEKKQYELMFKQEIQYIFYNVHVHGGHTG